MYGNNGEHSLSVINYVKYIGTQPLYEWKFNMLKHRTSLTAQVKHIGTHDLSMTAQVKHIVKHMTSEQIQSNTYIRTHDLIMTA